MNVTDLSKYNMTEQESKAAIEVLFANYQSLTYEYRLRCIAVKNGEQWCNALIVINAFTNEDALKHILGVKYKDVAFIECWYSYSGLLSLLEEIKCGTLTLGDYNVSIGGLYFSEQRFLHQKNPYSYFSGNLFSTHSATGHTIPYTKLVAPGLPYYENIYEAIQQWSEISDFNNDRDSRLKSIQLFFPERRIYIKDIRYNGDGSELQISLFRNGFKDNVYIAGSIKTDKLDIRLSDEIEGDILVVPINQDDIQGANDCKLFLLDNNSDILDYYAGNIMMQSVDAAQKVPQTTTQDEVPMTEENHEQKGTGNTCKVFISHSSKDKAIVDAFIDDILVGSLAIKVADIFCTSTDGTKITSGENWRDYIRQTLLDAQVTFLIITPNYKESEICLNEMGASWIASRHVVPLIVEPVSYRSVGVLQEVKQVERMLDEYSLDKLRDFLQHLLNIPVKDIKSDRWTIKKKEFIAKVNKHLEQNPFKIPMERAVFDELIDDVENCRKEKQSIIEHNEKLKQYCDGLKGAKDKVAVKAVLKEHPEQDRMKVFKGKCTEVHNLLVDFHGIVRGALYASYASRAVTIDIGGYRSVIDEAVANDYLSEPDLDVDWTTTKEMRELRTALAALERMMDKFSQDEHFMSEYEEQFEAPFKIENKRFWEEVLSVQVLLS